MKVRFNRNIIYILYYFGGIFLIGFFIWGIIYASQTNSTVLLRLFIVCSLIIPVAVIIDYRSGTLTDYVVIDEEGISYVSRRKKCRIIWTEIGFIGISKIGFGKSRVVVFSKNYDLSLLSRIFSTKMISNDFIYVGNRKGFIEEVKKHWGKEIINENKY
jgi:hypothetical protein